MIEDARTAYEAEDFTQALTLYLELHRQAPQDLAVLEGVARSYYGLKRYDEALEYSNLALSLKEEIAWPHLVRSFVYFLQRKMEASRTEAKIAFDKDPNGWEANFWWGSLLSSDGSTVDEGIVYMEKAASLHQSERAVYHNLSRAYLKKEQWKKYRDAMREMHRLKPLRYFPITINIELWGLLFGAIFILVYLGFCGLAIFLKDKNFLVIPLIMDFVIGAAGIYSIVNPFHKRRFVGIFVIIWSMVNLWLILRFWKGG